MWPHEIVILQRWEVIVAIILLTATVREVTSKYGVVRTRLNIESGIINGLISTGIYFLLKYLSRLLPEMPGFYCKTGLFYLVYGLCAVFLLKAVFKAGKLFLFVSRTDPVARNIFHLEQNAVKGVFREKIINNLGNSGDKRAVQPLIDELGNEKKYRKAAAASLAELGEPKWQQAIAGDDNDFARLARLNDRRAIKPLMRATGCGNNTDINKEVYQGNSPLIMAIYYKKPEIAGFFLSQKADVNIKNDDGNTALIFACAQGFSQLVKGIISGGAELNIQNKEGNTALIIACSHGFIDIVKLLVENEADTNIQNLQGDTALLQACSHGFPDMVKLLVEHGANVNLSKPNGTSPLFLAGRAGKKEITAFLLEHGADMNLANLSYHSEDRSRITIEDKNILSLLRGKGVNAYVKTEEWLEINKSKRFRYAFYKQTVEGDYDIRDEGERVIAEGILDEDTINSLKIEGSNLIHYRPVCAWQDKEISVDMGSVGVVKRYKLQIID